MRLPAWWFVAVRDALQGELDPADESSHRSSPSRNCSHSSRCFCCFHPRHSLEAPRCPPTHRCTGTTLSGTVARSASSSGPRHECRQILPRCQVNLNAERARCRSAFGLECRELSSEVILAEVSRSQSPAP